MRKSSTRQPMLIMFMLHAYEAMLKKNFKNCIAIATTCYKIFVSLFLICMHANRSGNRN